MINSFFTKEQEWLDKWDVFLQNSERGLYNQLSDWIKSYEVFGFDYEIFIQTKNDIIIGGCGIVIAKFSIFKFYIVPCGPVLDFENENQLDFILQQLKNNALKKGCCYFQISVPKVQNIQPKNDCSINNIQESSTYFSGNNGTKFKYVIPLYGMRLVDLSSKNYDVVFSSFGKNHKRNIIKSQSENLTFKFVTNPNDIETAYNCFVLNAQDKGYPLRSYKSIQKTLNAYITKDFAKMGCCYYNDKIVGAIYVMKCAKRYIYINGGVLKEFQHLNVSHFLHNYMIQDSLKKGFNYYDVSVGGSQGVIRFKEGFGSQLYNFIETKHWILKPFTFKIYLLIEKKIKPYKSKIADLLLQFKKIKL